MQSCTVLLERAEKDCSDSNVEKLVSQGRLNVYNPAEKIYCDMAYGRLCRLGQHLFDSKKYIQSYGVLTTALFFLDPNSLPAWIETFRKSTHSAVRANLKYANTTSLKLIKYLNISGATPAVQTDDFLDDMLDAASHLGSEKLTPPGVSFKSTAIVILKLVVKFSESTNYPRKEIVKTFLHKLKMDTLVAKIKADEIAAEAKLVAPTPAPSGGSVLEAKDSGFKRMRIK